MSVIESSVADRAVADRATTLELFFDLVYVFAFAQVTHLMADGGSISSVLGGLAVLGVLWWSWASHAWLANQRAADRGVVRVGIAIAIAIVLVLAIAIPDVYPEEPGDLFGPLLFAIGFIVLSIAYTVVNVLVAGRDLALRRQVLWTMSATIVPVSVALIWGAFLGGTAQLVLWLAAVALEGVTVMLTSRGGQWRLPSPGHYSERHGLVVILALGESIISIGFATADATLSPQIVGGSLLGIFLSLSLWWMYFGHISSAAERSIHALSGERRAFIATIGTYLHLGIVFGILLVSLGLAGGIEHVDAGEELGHFSGIALGAGMALFIASTAAYGWRVANRNPFVRIVATVVVIGLIPLFAVLQPPGAVAVAVALLVVVAAAERLSLDRPASAVS